MDKNKKTLFGIVAAIAVVCAVVALVVNKGGQKEGDKEVIKIGAILPLTGGAAATGQFTREGIELAVEEINSNPKSKYRIKMIIEDSANDPKTALTAFQKLVSIDKPSIIVTTFSSPSKAIAEYIKNNPDVNCVLFATAVTTPSEFAKISPNIFRLNFTPDQEGMFLANYFFSEKDYKTATIYHSDDDYGRELDKAVTSAIEQNSGKIIRRENFVRSQPDHRLSLTLIKEANPDICFFLGNDQTTAIAMRQAKQLGLTSVFVSSSATLATPSFWPVAGEGAEGAYYVTPAFDGESQDKLSKQNILKRNFEKKFNTQPSHHAGFTHETMMIIADCLNTIDEISTDNIRGYILQLKDYDSALGKLTCLPDGEINPEIILMKIIDQTAHQVK